jgi:hypothetical protein
LGVTPDQGKQLAQQIRNALVQYDRIANKAADESHEPSYIIMVPGDKRIAKSVFQAGHDNNRSMRQFVKELAKTGAFM